MTSRWTSFAFSFALLCACSGGTANTVPEQDASAPPPATTTPPAPPTSDTPPPVTSPVPDAGPDAAPSSSYCEFRTKTCKRSAATCAAETKCMGAMRPSAGAAIQSCVLSRKSCNQVDDCVEEEAAKYANETGAKVFRDSCLAKLASCGSAPFLDDDDCYNLVVFPDPTLAVFDACLAKPCAEAKTCVGSELAKLGCD